MANMKIENGKIIIDLHNYVRSLSKEEKLELVDYLSCEDQIIKNVVDQILDGFTEMMSCGGSSYPAESSPQRGLDYARREIAKRSSEVAKNQINQLQRAISFLNDRNDRLQKEIDQGQRRGSYGGL